MSRIFIWLLCFCGVGTLQAQYTFTGTIVDCQTRHPLSGATVELASLKKSVQTDTEGQFSFPDLPKGIHHFYVTKDDYKGHFFKVSLKKRRKKLYLCPLQGQRNRSRGSSGYCYPYRTQPKECAYHGTGGYRSGDSKGSGS